MYQRVIRPEWLGDLRSPHNADSARLMSWLAVRATAPRSSGSSRSSVRSTTSRAVVVRPGTGGPRRCYTQVAVRRGLPVFVPGGWPGSRFARLSVGTAMMGVVSDAEPAWSDQTRQASWIGERLRRASGGSRHFFAGSRAGVRDTGPRGRIHALGFSRYLPPVPCRARTWPQRELLRTRAEIRLHGRGRHGSAQDRLVLRLHGGRGR
jgi:hypothetical protein